MKPAHATTVGEPGMSEWPWPKLSALLLLLGLCLGLGGCTTWQQPETFDVSVLQSRAETDSINGVSLSAAVLSSSESQQMFGANVNATGVQPVWVKVENRTDQALWLLRSGADPDLFSPLEVAWTFHKAFAGETNARIDNHFEPGSEFEHFIFKSDHTRRPI